MQTGNYLSMIALSGALRFMLGVVGCALCAVRFALCTPVLAQETPPPIRLCVTLHDAQAASVPGATVIVRNADIDGEVGRAITAADGTACIASTATLDSVRVELQGKLANGTPLYHQAADIGGILFFPGSLGETRLDLLVATDGLVIPDPAMWALDPLPVVETPIPFDPTVPVATPARTVVPGPTAALVPTADLLLAPITEPAATEDVPAASSGLPFVLLLASGVILLGVGVGLVFKRHRH